MSYRKFEGREGFKETLPSPPPANMVLNAWFPKTETDTPILSKALPGSIRNGVCSLRTAPRRFGWALPQRNVDKYSRKTCDQRHNHVWHLIWRALKDFKYISAETSDHPPLLLSPLEWSTDGRKKKLPTPWIRVLVSKTRPPAAILARRSKPCKQSLRYSLRIMLPNPFWHAHH